MLQSADVSWTVFPNINLVLNGFSILNFAERIEKNLFFKQYSIISTELIFLGRENCDKEESKEKKEGIRAYLNNGFPYFNIIL